MKQKWINLLLLLAVVLIAGIIVADYLSTRPGRRPPNPYAFDVSEYELVDKSLVSYREVRQIRVADAVPVHLAARGKELYLLTAGALQVLTPAGEETGSFPLPAPPRCMTVTPGNILIIGFDDHLAAYTPTGELLYRSAPADGNARLTAVAAANGMVFAADAGNKQIIAFNEQLEQLHAFKGESGVSDLHGFILPSAHFDLAVNPTGELWVVNPGLHLLQNYEPDGRFRRHWGKPSFDIEGFSGCCNPSHIAFLPDGRMITSEKGLVRIKIYKESGELESVVAPPDAFKNGKFAPAIAVMGRNTIAALDYDRKMIRIFEEEKIHE